MSLCFFSFLFPKWLAHSLFSDRQVSKSKRKLSILAVLRNVSTTCKIIFIWPAQKDQKRKKNAHKDQENTHTAYAHLHETDRTGQRGGFHGLLTVCLNRKHIVVIESYRL